MSGEESIPYTRWQQATGDRASKEHAQERRDVLRTHVVHPLFEPNGCSRVDLVAHHVLRAPPPTPPVPVLPSAPADMQVEDPVAMRAMDLFGGLSCMDCE